eukprot:gene1291-1277_t
MSKDASAPEPLLLVYQEEEDRDNDGVLCDSDDSDEHALESVDHCRIRLLCAHARMVF